MTDMIQFVAILTAHNIDPKASVAVSLFQRLEDFFKASAPVAPADSIDLMRLREKLTGTPIHVQAAKVALNNVDVMDFVYSGQKIAAIKALREVIPGLGLKEAKDAIEDHTVWKFAPKTPNPYRPNTW